jgi:methionine sulfoxide reductase heme-binding subunit
VNSFATSGPDWYLMRASGVVSLILLSGVVALGIATANRWRPGRLPRFVTLNLHRNVSLLAVVFVAIHVLTALIDPYAAVTVPSVVVPFVAHGRAFWVGLGTVSLDLVLALIVSSLLRRHLSQRLWRGVHWLAYVSWPVALAHGLGIGTDTGTLWLQLISAVCVLLVGTAVVWRLGRRDAEPKHREPRTVAAHPMDEAVT